MSAGVVALVMVSGTVSPARSQALDLDQYRVVDLTHPLDADAVFWPTSPTRFELEQLAYGQTDAGYFYSANSFATPEHGGTHIDAPIHFHADGQTVDEIPVAQLMGRVVVIDVRPQAAADPDYTLSESDLATFEGKHGDIQPGTIVLLLTGWSERWPDAKAYLGDDTPGDASNLHFPSFGPEAARTLVEQRGIAALGADVASIDYGMTQDFMVHRIAASANVPGLENLTNLDQVPAAGAWVIALPIKIKGGSGGPVRAVALVPR